MTEQAYPDRMTMDLMKAVLKMVCQSPKNWQRSKILDGSILPDFVRSDKPNGYRSVYKDNFKKYKRYKHMPLCRYYLKIPGKDDKAKALDEEANNRFHGKSEKTLDNLKSNAKVRLAAADKGKTDAGKKSLFLGCVLHSIQDYYAHSYKGDLQEFKAATDKSVFSQMERAYHRDWYPTKADIELQRKNRWSKKELRDYLHKKFKDNPYSQFGLNKKGKWDWISAKEPTEEELEKDKKNKIKKNKRYEAAYETTIEYLLELLVKG